MGCKIFGKLHQMALHSIQANINYAPHLPQLEEHQLRECPYVECPVPGCGEIVSEMSSRKHEPSGMFIQALV